MSGTTPENPISGPSVPIYIILPGTPGGGLVDPDYGIDVGEQPGPQPPDGAHPSHPIVLPPEMPVDPDWGIEVPPRPDHELPGDQPEVSHPIVIPPYPDNSLPSGVDVGDLSFYQRKTLGITWDASVLKSAAVGVYAGAGGDESLSLVRTVANTGSSSVTYPQDFTGEVSIRVADGMGNFCEGTTTVK